MHVFLLYYLFGSPISICIRVCWTCCNMWLVCLFRGPFIFNWLQKAPCFTFWSKVRLGNMAENELILCKIRKVRFHVAFSAIFINIFTFWYRANWQWEMFALLYLSFYLIYFSWGLIIALLSGNLLEEVSVTYWKYERWHWKSNQAGVQITFQHLLLRLNKPILTRNDFFREIEKWKKISYPKTVIFFS